MEPYIIVIAIIGSALAGCINTLAGNGSAITLYILTDLIGLPPNIANGTNRIGIAAQSFASTYVFYKNGRIDITRTWIYIILIVIGAIAGILVATQISNEQFRMVFRYLLLVMLVIILIKPKRWLIETDVTQRLPLVVSIPIFLLLGFYGGFIQMGMGIFYLATMVLIAKFSLIDSNGVKSLVVGIYTVFALVIFHFSGFLNWQVGALMAVGQTVGGFLTAKFASNSEKANVWAHRLLVVVVIWAIVKMFNLFDFMFG